MHHEWIAILDFGSQYTQLIARRIRECQVYCEILPHDTPANVLRARGAAGIVFSGGPASVYEADAPQADPAIYSLGIPILGICYGMQLFARDLGGAVEPGVTREFGPAIAHVLHPTGLLEGLNDNADGAERPSLYVWMSHGDKVTALPPGFCLMASTESCPIAGMADESRRIYGLQFHPEVTHTRRGAEILRRFAREICRTRGDWRMGDYMTEAIASIREKVGRDHVLLGLSGGVDSSVAAALIHRAIGDQLICVFVDHGLLRLGESDQVMQTFSRHLGARVIRVDAADRFFAALQGVADPEQKRKIIGREFVHVFQEEAERLRHEDQEIRWLAQGTIYPDVIESAGIKGKQAHTIKSHHNVGGLPETLRLRLLEPLRDLFKDEVRELGLALGLPREMVYRHPFPGPGLGVRILGEVRREYAEILRRADAIFLEELRRAPAEAGRSWYDDTAQAFAVFLPVRSVGVMGDGRTYEHVIALRAVQTTDFMTAHAAPIPHEFLSRVANRIINEVRGVNRVVYDVSSKPPSTIEWE
ncbi:MAG: glutamine-hydrolyzing GMP synthase [Kiritimatiellae bacterium]|nr:glutamine-hydrolyzing GMP synthase [Kiritimatiellia bacterium]MDW8459470.1 glutamine-hydrolyzing GMP synthase [Verrucomicrobiota bacterium]